MYCLTFKDECGKIEKRFYYNNFINAVQMQRDLLILEINKLIADETDEGPIEFKGEMSNYDLQRLERVLLMLAYKDDFDNVEITVKVDEIICEDSPLLDF